MKIDIDHLNNEIKESNDKNIELTKKLHGLNKN